MMCVMSTAYYAALIFKVKWVSFSSVICLFQKLEVDHTYTESLMLPGRCPVVFLSKSRLNTNDALNMTSITNL